jgi:tRNA threonylcarbamoyladenosine biosynthesis protein TsaB
VSTAQGSPALAVALETSTRRPSIAVRVRGEVHERVLDAGRAHAADLLPALERLLADLGASPRELGAVLCGTGPGSYTGLRVGAATALGLARASGALLCGVPSFEALASGALRSGQEGLVLLDARAGELYRARYRRTPTGIEVLEAPCVTTRAELALLDTSGLHVLADDAALAAAGWSDAPPREPVRDAHPSAAIVLTLGLERLASGAIAGVEPLYLRPFAMRSQRR